MSFNYFDSLREAAQPDAPVVTDRRFQGGFAPISDDDFVTLIDGRTLLKSRLQGLEYGEDFLKLRELNEQKRRGFVEAMTDVDRWKQNIPIAGHAMGTVLPIRDLLQIKHIMTRLNAGESVSDEEMLKVQLFIEDQQRMSEASRGGMVGEVVRNMIGFGLELGAEMAVAGYVGGKLGLVGGPEGVPIGAAAGAFAAGVKKAGEGTVRGARHLVGKVVSRNVKDQVARMLATTAGKQIAKRSMSFAAGTVGAAYGGTILSGIEFGSRGLYNLAVGQDFGTSTEAAERYAGAAIGGEELSWRNAQLLAMADKWVENISEMAGATGTFEALIPGGSNQYIVKAMEKVFGKHITTGDTAAIKAALSTAKGAQRAKLTAALATASLVGRLAKDGDLAAALKRLGNFAYDGYVEELLEERYGDFIRGFVGLEGDRKGIRNAIDQMIPDKEQFAVELISFAWPMAMQIGAHRAHLAIHGAGRGTFLKDADTLVRGTKDYSAPGRKLQIIEQEGALPVLPEGATGPQVSLGETGDTVSRVAREVRERPLTPLGKALSWMVEAAHFAATGHIAGLAKFGGMDVYLANYGRAAFVGHHNLVYNAVESAMLAENESRKTPWTKAEIAAKAEAEAREATMDLLQGWRKSLALRESILERMNISEEEAARMTPEELREKLQQAANDGLIARIDFDTGRLPMWVKRFEDGADNPITSEMSDLYDLVSETMARHGFNIDEVTLNSAEDYRRRMENPLFGIAHAITAEELDEVIADPLSIRGSLAATIMNDISELQGSRRYDAIREWARWMRAHVDAGSFGTSYEALNPDGTVSGRIQLHRRGNGKVYLSYSPVSTGRVNEAAEAKVTAQKSRSDIAAINQTLGTQETGDNVAAATAALERLGYSRKDNMLILSPHRWFKATDPRFLTTNLYGMQDKSALGSDKPEAILAAEAALRDLLNVSKDSDGYYRINIGSVNNEDVTRIAPHLDTYHAWEELAERLFKQDNVQERGAAHKADPRITSYFFNAVTSLREAAKAEDISEESRRAIYKLIDLLGDQQKSEAAVKLFGALFLGAGLDSRRRYGMSPIGYMDMIRVLRPFLTSAEGFQDYVQYMAHNILGIADAAGVVAPSQFELHYAGLHNPLSRAAHAALLSSVLKGKVDAEVPVAKEAPSGDMPLPKNPSYRALQQRAKQLGVEVEKGMSKAKLQALIAKAELGLIQGEASPVTAKGSLDTLFPQSKVEYDKETHTYKIDGEVRPSVTQLMEQNEDLRFDKAAVAERQAAGDKVIKQKILDRWKADADEGTAMHAELEAALKGGEVPEHLRELVDFLKSKGDVVSERIVWTDNYAGTADVIVVQPDGKLALYDLKTLGGSPYEKNSFYASSYKGTPSRHDKHVIQLMAYRQALEQAGFSVSEMGVIPASRKTREIYRGEIGDLVYPAKESHRARLYFNQVFGDEAFKKPAPVKVKAEPPPKAIPKKSPVVHQLDADIMADLAKGQGFKLDDTSTPAAPKAAAGVLSKLAQRRAKGSDLSPSATGPTALVAEDAKVLQELSKLSLDTGVLAEAYQADEAFLSNADRKVLSRAGRELEAVLRDVLVYAYDDLLTAQGLDITDVAEFESNDVADPGLKEQIEDGPTRSLGSIKKAKAVAALLESLTGRDGYQVYYALAHNPKSAASLEAALLSAEALDAWVNSSDFVTPEADALRLALKLISTTAEAARDEKGKTPVAGLSLDSLRAGFATFRSMVQTSGAVMLSDGSIEIRNRMVPYAQAKADSERMRDHYVSHPRDLAKAVVEPYHRWVNRLKATEAAFADIKVEGRHVAALRTAELVKVLQTNDKLRSSLFEILSAYSGLSESFFGEVASSPAGLLALSEFVGTPFNFQFAPSSPVFGGSTIHTLRATPKADAAVNARLAAIRKAYEDAWLGVNLEKGSAVSRLASLMAHSSWTGEGTGTVFDAANKQQAGWIQHSKLTMKLRGFFERFGAVNWNDSEFTKKHPEALDPSNLIHLAAVTDAKGGERELKEASPAEMEHIIQEMERKGYLYLGVFGDNVNKMFARVQWLTPDQALTQYREWLTDPQKLVLEQAALVPIEELEALRARYDKATSKTERLEIQIAMNRPLMWGVLNDMVDGSLRYYLTGADVPAWALQKVSEVDAKYLDKSGKFVNDKSRKALKNVLSKSLDAAAKRRSNDLTGGLIGDLLEEHLKKLAPHRVNGKIRNVVLEYSGPRDGLNFDKRMDGMVIHRENTLGKAAVSAFGQMFAGGNEQHGASSLKFQISGVDAHGKPRLGKFHSQGVESLAGDREAFAQLRSFMQFHDIDQVTLVASEKVPSKQYFAEFRKGKADRIAVSNFADLLKLDTTEVAKSMQYVDGKDMIFPLKLHGETTIQRAKFGKQLLHIISSFRNSDVYTRLFEQWTAANQQSNDFTNPAVLEAAVIRQLERGDPYSRQLALALRNGTMTLSSAATRNRMHIMSAIVRASQFRTGRRRGTVIMDIEGSGIAKDAYRLITNTGKYQAVFNAPERGVYDHVKLGKVQSLDEAKAALAAWYTDAYSQLNKGHALPRSARERADFAFAPGRMPLGHLFQTNTGADIVIPAGDNRLAFTTDAGGNALLRSSRPIVRLTDEGTVDPTSFRDDVFFQEGGVWYALGSAFVGDRIPADGVQSMAPLYKRAGFKNALVSGIEAAAAFIARVGGDGDGDATNLASLGTDFSDSAEGFANAFVNQLIHDFETSPEIREWASKGIDALTEMDEQIGEQVKFAEDTPIPVIPVGNSWERTLYMLKIGQIGMQTVGVAAKSNAAMQRALDLGAHTPVNATLTVTDADGNPVSLSIGRSAAAAAAITKDKHYWNRARMALFVGPQREISSSVDDAKYLTQGHLGFTPWVKAWVSTAIAFSNDIVEREGTFNFDAEFIDAAKVAEHIIRFAAYSPFFAEVNRLTTATAEHLTNKNAKPTMKPKAAMEHIIKKALNPKSRERTFVTEAEQEAYKALRESEAYKALDEKEKAAARYNFTLNETNIGNVLKIQEMAESLRALGQVTDLLINDPKAHTLDALDQYETSLDTVLAGVVDAEGLEAKQYSIYKPEMPPSSSIFYLYGTKLNHAIRNFNYFQSIAPHVYFAASPAGRAAQDRIRHEYKVKGQFTTPINTLFGLLQVQMAASRMREAWTGDALDMRFTPARLTALRAENVIQEPGKRPRVNQFLEAIWTSGAVDGGLVIAPPFGGKGASQMTEEAQQQARNDFDLLPEKLKLEIALSAYSTQVPSAGPAAHSFNQLMGNLTNSEFLKRLAQYESDAHEFLANTKSRAVVDLLANVVQLKGKDRYAARDHIARELVGVSYNRVSNAPFWAVDSAWEPAFDQAESASIFADEEFEVVAPPPEVYDPEIVGEATLEPSVKEVPETVKQVKQDFADFLEQKAQGRKTAEAAETAPVVRAFLQARSESSPYNAKEAAKADYVAGAPNRSWVLAPAMEQVAAGKKSFAVRLHHAALEHKVALFSLSDVEPGDRIYVSVPGFRRRAEPEALRSLIDTAMRAADLGAEIITDTEHHATRAHNVGGESVLREALLEAGLTELPEADFSVWKRTKDTRKPVGDSTINDAAASEAYEADDFIPPPPSAEELGYEESELRGLFPPDATDEMWEGPISLEPPLEGEEIRVSMGEEAPATPVAERKPGDIQLDDLPDPSTAGWVVASMDKNALPEGVPSKVGTIPVELSDKGLVRLHEGKLIFNEADARKEYARKPWADPPGGETPLPADAFRSFPEWLNFKLHKQAVLSTSPQVRADNPLHGLLQDNANRTAALHTGIHGRLYGKVAGAQSKADAQRKVSNENARRVREVTAPQTKDKTPAPEVQGANIWSGAKGLAAALTNMTELARRKGRLAKAYPVTIGGQTFVDAEAAYKSRRSGDTAADRAWMTDVIEAKLRQHPELVEGIDKAGGEAWLNASWHRTGTLTNRWTSVMPGKSLFIQVLRDAYNRVKGAESPTASETGSAEAGTPAPQAQESKTPGTSPLSPSATAPSARDALLNEYRRQRDARVSKLEQYLATQDAVKLPYAPRSKLTKAEATKEQGVWTIRLTGEDGKVHVTEGLDARQLGNTILDSVTDFRADSAPHHDQFIHASPRLAGILMEETAASEHVRAYAAEAIAALNLNPERYEQDVASVYRGAIDYAEKQGARATAELLRVLADNRALQPQRLEVRWDGAVLSTWDFLEPDRWQPEGYVRVDTNTLVLGTGALQNAKTAQTVLTHELLHAATAGLLNTNNDFRQSMEILRDIAEQYAVGDMRDAYGLTNVHEFVSEAFTNAKFRQFLASVESPLNTLPPGNLWQRFVALVKEYIGKLNPGKNTLLQNVVDVTLRNLDERLAEEAAWEADWESMLQADAATLSFGPSATAATADQQEAALAHPSWFSQAWNPLPELVERVQSQYEKAIGRTDIEPADLRQVLKDNFLSVVLAENGRDAVIGKSLGPVLMVSHFAPETMRGGVAHLQQLQRANTPVLFAVPGHLGNQLERLGYRKLFTDVRMIGRDELHNKNIYVNPAFSREDLRLVLGEWGGGVATKLAAQLAQLKLPARAQTPVWRESSVTADQLLTNLNKFFHEKGFEIQWYESLPANLRELGVPYLINASRKIAQMPEGDLSHMPETLAEFLSHMVSFHGEMAPLYQQMKDTPLFKQLLEQTAALAVVNGEATNLDVAKTQHHVNRAARRLFVKTVLQERITQEMVSKGLLSQTLLDKIKQVLRDVLARFRGVDARRFYDYVDNLVRGLAEGREVVFRTELPANYAPLDTGETLRRSVLTDEVVKTLGAHPAMMLTGSVAFGAQGSVARPADADAHDLDWRVLDPNFTEADGLALLQKHWPGTYTMYHSFSDIRAALDNDFNITLGRSYTTTSFLVPSKGHQIANVTRRGNKIATYDVVTDAGEVVNQYKSVEDRNTGRVIESWSNPDGERPVMVDFFTGDAPATPVKYAYTTRAGDVVNIQLAPYSGAFEAKLRYSRLKDIVDYNRFVPNATQPTVAPTASPPTAPIHERATTPKQLGNWMARAYATKHAANPADVGRLQRLVNSSLEPVLAGVAERQTFEEVVEFLHDIDPAKLHGDGGYFLGRIEAWAREHKQQNFTPEFIADIVAGRNTSASMQHFNSDYDSLEFSPSATSIFASPYTVGNTAAGGGATHMTNVLVKEAAFAARATNLVKRWQVHLINEWGLDGFIRPFVEHKFNIRPDGSVGEHKARGTRMFLAKRGGRKMTADQHKAVALMGHAAFLGFEHTHEGPDGKRVWTGEDFGVLMPMLPWHADSRMLEALLPKSLAQELIWLRAKALEGVVRPMRTEDETEDSWRKRVATYERAVALRMSKAGIGAFQAVGRTWKQNLNVANMLKYEAAVTNPSKSLEFRDHWHARNIVFSIPASMIEKAFAADARKALIDMGRSPNRLTLAAFLNSAVQELDKVREAHNDNMPWSMHGDAMYLRTHKAYAPHWMGTGFAGANAGEAENAVQDLIRKIRKAQIDSVRAGVLAKKRKDNTLDSASDNMIRYMLELHGIPFHSGEEARKSIVDGDFEEMGIPRTADYYFIADAIHTAVSNVLVERAVHKQKIEERLGSIQNPVELAAAMREEWEARRDREVSHRAKRRVYTNFMEAYTMGNRRPLNIDAASAVNKYASEVLRSSQQRILLNEFVNTVDDFGRTQVVPDPDMMGELTHENEILSEQSWEQVLSNLAAQYKFQINPEKSTKANIRDIIDMHIKGSDRYTRVKSPFASIVEFYAYKRPVMEENIMDSAIAGGEVAGILKKLVTKPWQDPLKIIRFFEHVNAWMKVKALQMSLFFPIAAQESVVALLGTDRFRTPEGMPSMLELRKMIVTNHPWAMNMLRQAMDAGIELGDVSSPLDLPMDLVERDVQDLTNFTRRNFGEQSAKIVNTIAGMDTKQSRFMFETYFNTVKLWGFIRFAHQLESKAIAEGRPFNLREELAPYVNQINQEIGGINWNKYSWMTPSWRRNMQLLMFSPNWSMSAWNAAGFGALIGPIMKNFMTADELNLVITRRWPSMFLYVMLLPPLMMQAFAYGVGKAFGPPDDDDELLMFNNEDGRKLHADLTPLMRLMPWYSGGQTGKRRVYIQWGKQAYETKRWLESPWNSLLNKTSQLARWAIEMATGESAGGYHWDLPFKGEGLLGWFRDRDGSFMGSRLAYTAQKFMPFTILAWASNPDASPFQILGPTSKGVSFHKATETYMSILDAWARRETYQKIHNNPTIQHNLETLGWEILDGARRNGYDSQKVFKSAYGAVIKDLYANLYKAINRNDMREIERWSRAILRLNGTVDNTLRSLRNRDKMHGEPEERTAEKEELIRQAFREP